ncbi:prealbumin-like fold domain-containing protein [Flavobacterium proteolyticum]|uniref:SpaA-like prealbumin fold domain-containing protein n=1 Tax=Flavobacterium proteolyticum TaxID=2911683 RepID=A0ABR9WTJ9_9FLAO|nr:prealbumin-like fold domain-containing protein [Flavobacterium proteolyticum]MBE9576982.1 hypothetical protein [Flavobacterium proteolyticum]
MKHLKFILPLFLILFACSPDSDDTAEDTRLELTVLDESSTALENIEVKLYTSQEDYDNDTNIIATSTTNANGKVTFENLQPLTYYWKTTADCYLENAIYNTVDPIVGNTLNLFSTNLTSNFRGDLIFKNNTLYNCNVTYTGPISDSQIVVPGLIIYLEGWDTGVYNFEITPTEGPNQGQTTYQTLTLNCGSQALLEIN